jgi:predicted nucleic acid-binding protein
VLRRAGARNLAETRRLSARVYASITAAGRKARGRRAMELLIAATALAAGLPLYTRNPDDFASLGELLDIIAV